MTNNPNSQNKESLLISRSRISSRVNKTGSWRYLQPAFSSGMAPCRVACPVGNDIATMIHLTSQGRYQDALTNILQENPLPAVCGYVCDHPCESSCNRAQLDAPLAVNAIERFVGFQAMGDPVPTRLQRQPANGMRVALIGSGPSGLSAAYFLGRLGYDCDVFESEAEPGGLLRWGVPEYRLPRDVLQHEIGRIQDLGVRIHCSQAISADFLQSARKDYQAVFVGCGLGRSVPMQVPGEEHALDGLTLLKSVRRGNHKPLKGVSAVVGGGNTAIDVARTLMRLGSQAIILYRRRVGDMPAFKEEVQAACREGVEIRELTIPVKILPEQDGLEIHLQHMAVADKKTDHGRTAVHPDAGKTETLQVARMVSAIGAEAQMIWQPYEKEESIRLSMSHCALTGDEFPIAYGGDIVNRKLRVSDAISSGKQAAMAIDLVLEKRSPDIENEIIRCRVGSGVGLSMTHYMAAADSLSMPSRMVAYEDINTAYFSPAIRLEAERPPKEKNVLSFSAQPANYTPQSASEEAGRCFTCGVCTDCDNCGLFCPETAVGGQKGREIDLDYCKGCGVCVQECPRSAMILQEMGYETGS